jgi:very-short-patch-repair endonuclease
MAEKRDTPDRVVAVVAARQHGVVTTAQLRAAGLSHDAILVRARSGRLHWLYRKVYAVGHSALSQEGRWMAAVLAHGESAVLSFRSAGELWGLLPTHAGPIDVSIPSGAGASGRDGVRLHRCPTLSREQRTRRHDIPVTTPSRTFVDLKRTLSPAELRNAIRQAEVAGLEIGTVGGVEGTRSELETMFLRVCREHGLPRPQVNVDLGPCVVDFLWRSRRLVVETDGYRFHQGRAAFERDRDRDLTLRGMGYQVIRLSYRQVADEPERVAATLRSALS